MDLFTLTQICAPSGSEYRAADSVKQLLAPYTDEVRMTALGSAVGIVSCGRSGAKKILLDAHFDEVGAFVTEITDDGFVRLAVNGMDRRVMLNADYTILGKKQIRCIPAVLPPHLQKESGKVPEDRDMLFDTGMSGDELRKEVSIGDAVVYARRHARLLGGRVMSAAADDRACCAAVLRTLELLKDNKLNVDIIVSFTSQEEAGGSGALTAAFELKPDEAVILDVSFAQTPDTDYPDAGELGGGAMIGISPLLSREMFGRLKQAAQRAGVKWQTEVMPRDTGTDADEISRAGGGVPCGMLSVPLRYMHTYSEVVDEYDMEATAAVLAEYIRTESASCSD